MVKDVFVSDIFEGDLPVLPWGSEDFTIFSSDLFEGDLPVLREESHTLSPEDVHPFGVFEEEEILFSVFFVDRLEDHINLSETSKQVREGGSLTSHKVSILSNTAGVSVSTPVFLFVWELYTVRPMISLVYTVNSSTSFHKSLVCVYEVDPFLHLEMKAIFWVWSIHIFFFFFDINLIYIIITQIIYTFFQSLDITSGSILKIRSLFLYQIIFSLQVGIPSIWLNKYPNLSLYLGYDISYLFSPFFSTLWKKSSICFLNPFFLSIKMRQRVITSFKVSASFKRTLLYPSNQRFTETTSSVPSGLGAEPSITGTLSLLLLLGWSPAPRDDPFW